MATMPPWPQGERWADTRRPRAQENLYPVAREINITEGGEFLDDAIRVKEQPLQETSHKRIKISLRRYSLRQIL